MKKKNMKSKFMCCNIILTPFIQCVDDYFLRNRKEIVNSGEKISNPFFFIQGEFISLEGIDRYGNIIYKEKQSGTKPDFKYHIISVAMPYTEYKPYHENWMKQINRQNKLEELVF